VNPDVEGFLNRAEAAEPGGTIVLDTADGNGAGHLDFAAFARSRHSVRNFADRPVDEATILGAIDTARFAPSVCNRSSGRVYYSFDRKDITEALKVQQGATGFMATIPCLMVVVSDRRAFYSVGERNQCFVDGGLFAMSLVYALHGLGLGTCMLNWSKTPKVDQDLRRRFRIDDEHEIISLVAVGHRPDNVRVARSPRADAASFHRKLQARA
jgi:nitroreductase